MADLGSFIKSTLSGLPAAVDAMKVLAKDELQERLAKQIASKESFMESVEEMTNPFSKYATKRQDIRTRMTKPEKSTQTVEKKAIDPIERLKDLAGQFQRRNPELKAFTLVRLRELIKEGQSKEEILKIVQEFYPDPFLADEVLDFLLEDTDGELNQTIKDAKDQLKKDNERAIIAGRNISGIVKQAAEKGIDSPTNLREMYKDITGNPRDSVTLFQELAQKYAFKDLNKVISFLLHSLGSDLKSKGPSIARGLLHRLLTETRSLQAILGVYRFFRSRMNLMQGLFRKGQLDMPPQLTFEVLAKQFIGLVGDRYPSSDKMLQMTAKLGLEKWLLAKIIVLSQFRDAIREVAVYQIYASLQHRDEIYMAIIEALENLEEALEEFEEQQERQGGGKDEEEEEQQQEGKEEKKRSA